MNSVPEIVTAASGLLTSIYPIIVAGVGLWIMLALAKIANKGAKISYDEDMDRLAKADNGLYGPNRKSYRRHIYKTFRQRKW